MASHYSDYARFVSKAFIDASDSLRAGARVLGHGVAVQPFVYNTGLNYTKTSVNTTAPNAVALYAASQGDVTSMDGYRSPLAATNTGGLQGSPWLPVSMGGPMPTAMQGFRMLGKPHVIYETSFFRPYPYRAEWGPVMAAYALKQDWDAVYLYSQGDGPSVYGTQNSGFPAQYGTVRLPDPGASASTCDKAKYTEGFKHGGDPIVQASWALGGRLVTRFSDSPPVQITWKINNNTLFASGANNGFPPNFLSSLGDARSNTVAIQFTGPEDDTSCTRCVNANAIPLTTFAVEWNTSMPQFSRRLVVSTDAAVAVSGQLTGDLGTLLGYRTAIKSNSGFGTVGVMRSDLSGRTASFDTLILAGNATNKNFAFNAANADVSDSAGPMCGVTNGGTAPIQWSQPQITFTYGAARTYVPHGFDFSTLPQPPRSPVYITPTSGQGATGVFWVDSAP